MSNKIVPQVYRSVIDNVIDNIRSEFDEYGVSEDVLADLQTRWESKIIASKVAEFEADSRQNTNNAHESSSSLQPSIPALQASFPPPPPPPHPTHYPHPSHFPPSSSHNQYQNNGPLPPISVKTEAGEPSRYPPPPPGQAMHLQTYVLPHPLHGHSTPHSNHPVGSESVLQFQQRPPPPPAPQYSPQPHHPAPPSQAASQPSQQIPRRSGGPPPWIHPSSPSNWNDMPKIPQFDGAASTSSNSSNTPPPGAGLPGSSQVKAIGASEEINSDLDDSESEGEGAEEAETGGPEQDIVFCTYDKVARVKNKWKCVLKDGMVHINGKDYLFTKCTGEFEW